MATQNGIHASYSSSTLRIWQNLQSKLSKDCFIYPLFIADNKDAQEIITSMPGQYRLGENKLLKFLEPLVYSGLKAVLLFGVPPTNAKDEFGTNACGPDSIISSAVRKLRSLFPTLLIICDICLCAYTSHGHCGILNSDGTIDLENTMTRLVQMSLDFASAGCHVVAPSDMMDGRIAAIKTALNKHGFGNRVPVMSYAAKFASCFYGPFRDAAHSSPAFGDRRSYQLPPGSTGLAVRAVNRDVMEGADMLMVKPALAYLDIIYQTKEKYPDFVVAAYQVSGEYVMMKNYAQITGIPLKTVVLENTTAIRRAGADLIISYFTPELLGWLSEDFP